MFLSSVNLSSLYCSIPSEVSGTLTLFVVESISTVSAVLLFALLLLISAMFVSIVPTLTSSEILHLTWISLKSIFPVVLSIALIKLFLELYLSLFGLLSLDKYVVLIVLNEVSDESNFQPYSALKLSFTNSKPSGKWSVISSAYPSISPSL